MPYKCLITLFADIFRRFFFHSFSRCLIHWKHCKSLSFLTTLPYQFTFRLGKQWMAIFHNDGIDWCFVPLLRLYLYFQLIQFCLFDFRFENKNQSSIETRSGRCNSENYNNSLAEKPRLDNSIWMACNAIFTSHRSNQIENLYTAAFDGFTTPMS